MHLENEILFVLFEICSVSHALFLAHMKFLKNVRKYILVWLKQGSNTLQCLHFKTLKSQVKTRTE